MRKGLCASPPSTTHRIGKLQMGATYFLSYDAYVCCTGHYCVFLDLTRDRYFSVRKDALDRIAHLIHGWPITCVPCNPTSTNPDDASLAEALVKAGVFCLQPTQTKPATRLVISPQRTVPSLVDATDLRQHQGTKLRTKLDATAAMARAHFYLSRRTMGDIARAFHRRETRLTPPVTRAEVERAVELTRVFARCRPYFPRNYLCMFDSLALQLYLSLYGLASLWVFGVREDPFLAHCWVQIDDMVLNDYADRVSTFTPIMALQQAVRSPRRK